MNVNIHLVNKQLFPNNPEKLLVAFCDFYRKWCKGLIKEDDPMALRIVNDVEDVLEAYLMYYNEAKDKTIFPTMEDYCVSSYFKQGYVLNEQDVPELLERSIKEYSRHLAYNLDNNYTS